MRTTIATIGLTLALTGAAVVASPEAEAHARAFERGDRHAQVEHPRARRGYRHRKRHHWCHYRAPHRWRNRHRHGLYGHHRDRRSTSHRSLDGPRFGVTGLSVRWRDGD